MRNCTASRWYDILSVCLTEEELCLTTDFLMLVCSEPITEEGDGESEHLPSEDGDYSTH